MNLGISNTNNIIGNFINNNAIDGPIEIKREDKSVKFVDNLKPINNILTDFVTNDVLKTNAFIRLVVTDYDAAIKTYCDIKKIKYDDVIFIYKGGNIMRILSEQINKIFPENKSEEFNQYYVDSFKKSDADFSIYINPSLANFEQIKDELTIKAYEIQLSIKQKIFGSNNEFLKFYNADSTNQIATFKELLAKINNENLKQTEDQYKGTFTTMCHDNVCFGEKQSQSYNNKSNFIMINGPNHDINLLYGLKSDETNKYAYTSINKTLTFLSDAGSTVSFVLIRSKLSFPSWLNNTKLLYLNGEMIDVTITNKEDSALKHFSEHINKYVSVYKVDDEFSFKGYSLTYIIEDLERILYTETNCKPWLDEKYEKRTKRLMYFYFTELFVDDKYKQFTFAAKQQYLSLIYKVLTNEISYNDFNIEFKKLFNGIRITDFTYGKLVKGCMVNIVNKNAQKNPNDTKERSQKYQTLLNENLIIQYNLLSKLGSFCINGAHIDNKDLINTGGLIGS